MRFASDRAEKNYLSDVKRIHHADHAAFADGNGNLISSEFDEAN